MRYGRFQAVTVLGMEELKTWVRVSLDRVFSPCFQVDYLVISDDLFNAFVLLGYPVGGMDEDIGSMANRLSLSDVEAKRVVVPGGIWGGDKKDYELCLVGRFLTSRRHNFAAVQDTFTNVLNPTRGMTVEKLGNGRIIFVFNHVVDRDRVLTRGLWNFRNDLLVLKTLTDSEDPATTEMNWNDMHVQVHGLPIGKRTWKIAEFIGNRIGKFKDTDLDAFGHNWNAPLRIRVSMDVTKPLHRFMKMQVVDGKEINLTFAYERLGNFCYLCGKLSHTSDSCDIRYEDTFVDLSPDLPFSPDLRALPPRNFLPPGPRPRADGESNWRASHDGTRSAGVGRSRHEGSPSLSSNSMSHTNSLARFRSPQMGLSPFTQHFCEPGGREEETSETDSSLSKNPDNDASEEIGTRVPRLGSTGLEEDEAGVFFHLGN
ncbi:hypothetical protein BUALT_Bualt09G0069000 [Buddleja alternifolia]|uniref:DUF4283 domain-containing protein n=1 Tax=Buddleja alternifolia TaxID=168488 RepID=A0AAV6X153_9LAMI|nr:hypothetical protein BUALT_Bualt09G0069000 [Buddleja alternifolia]